MLTDPQGFPDEWAVIHSFLAVILVILMFIIYVWIILADIKLFRKNILLSNVFLKILALVHLQMWIIYYLIIVNII